MKKYLHLVSLIIFITTNVHALDILSVGVSCPLSGDLAEYGVAVKNGITLAREENLDSFKSINISFEDNEYSSIKSVSVFNNFRNIKKVDLIYNWGEATLHAIAPLAEKYKLPILAMSLDQRPALNQKYIIRSINPSIDFTNKMVAYFKSKEYKKIGIIKIEDPFFNNLLTSLKKSVHIDNVYSFNPDVKDFKVAITRLKRDEFDIIGVYLFPGQVSNFYKQANALRLKAPTFGTDIFDSKSEIKNSNGTMEGAVYPNISLHEKFIKSYNAKYKNDNQIAYAYNAYVSIKAVARRVNSKEFNKESMLDSLLKHKKEDEFTIVQEKNGDKYFKFDILIKEIKNGEILVFKENL